VSLGGNRTVSQDAGDVVATVPLAPPGLTLLDVRRGRGSGDESRSLGSVELMEHAIRRGEGMFSESGALVVETGIHTGRSPRDKFIVRHGHMADAILLVSVTQPMDPAEFSLLHADIVDYLAGGDRYRVE